MLLYILLLLLLLAGNMEDLFPVFLVVFVSVSAIFYLIFRGKSLNFVEFTDTEIRHQKTTYSWTDVHISVMYRSSLEIPFSFPPVYYVYFNDHYLTREETLTKEILREGFYVELDLKRTELLLCLA